MARRLPASRARSSKAGVQGGEQQRGRFLHPPALVLAVLVMAAGQYKYDNEGAQFLTFVLTFLLVALLPLTYSLFSSKRGRGATQGWFDAKGQKVQQVKQAHKRSLTNPRLSGK